MNIYMAIFSFRLLSSNVSVMIFRHIFFVNWKKTMLFSEITFLCLTHFVVTKFVIILYLIILDAQTYNLTAANQSIHYVHDGVLSE